MKKIRVLNIVGARPNFMKIAPLMKEMKKDSRFSPSLVHTGQHYDTEMSHVFFEDLKLPKPDIYLGVGSGHHAKQTAKVMIELEKILLKTKPDLVIVVGDVNSTLAASLVVAKLHIPLAHIEAGLRSFDKTMPEEINRRVTDALSDYIFTTDQRANTNLLREGLPKSKIFFVGNVMIDTLKLLYPIATKRNTFKALKVKKKDYTLLTLHRPSNVDNKVILLKLLEAINTISQWMPIVFPIHPRTKARIKSFRLNRYLLNPNFKVIEPVGYIDFLNLMMNSKCVLTDSGGIQEETTVLKVPCLTLRENTERPITVFEGTNTLVGSDTDKVITLIRKIIRGTYKKGKIPRFWDGNASRRIMRILAKHLL